MFQRLFNKPSIEEVSAEEARAKQKSGAVLVDVREMHEWNEGHIPGARHIPLGSLAKRAKELDPAKEIIAVCRSGSRSITAAMILQHAGYTNVSSMAGGMISWTRHRFPVTR